jgi:hypothetical protein
MARTRALGGIAHFALRRARRAPRRSIPPQNSETLVAELCHELARECCKEAFRAQQTATTAPQLAEQKRRQRARPFAVKGSANRVLRFGTHGDANLVGRHAHAVREGERAHAREHGRSGDDKATELLAYHSRICHAAVWLATTSQVQAW